VKNKMKNYSIEMNYGINVTLSIMAETQEEALEKAKKIVSEDVAINEGYLVDDVSELFFEDVTYIKEEN
jgi:hypothetical protein